MTIDPLSDIIQKPPGFNSALKSTIRAMLTILVARTPEM